MNFLQNLLRLIFLTNVLQLGIVEDEGGGSTGSEGDNGDAGGSEGGTGDNGDDESRTGSDDNSSQGNDDGANGFDSFSPEAQKMIKDLRAENAKSRTKNKGIEERFGKLEKGLKSALGLGEDDQVSPEEQVASLTGQNDGLASQNAILEVAIENGLNKEQASYFTFLLQQEAQSMEDGDEMTEERYDEIIGQSKGHGVAAKKKADTDADGDGGNPNPNKGNGDTVTVEQFSKMSYTEKSQLRAKNVPLYDKLFSGARAKRLI